jgi:hypothetical protein
MRVAADRLDVAVLHQGMHLVAYLCDGLCDIAIEAAAQPAGIVVRAQSVAFIAQRARAQVFRVVLAAEHVFKAPVGGGGLGPPRGLQGISNVLGTNL